LHLLILPFYLRALYVEYNKKYYSSPPRELSEQEKKCQAVDKTCKAVCIISTRHYLFFKKHEIGFVMFYKGVPMLITNSNIISDYWIFSFSAYFASLTFFRENCPPIKTSLCPKAFCKTNYKLDTSVIAVDFVADLWQAPEIEKLKVKERDTVAIMNRLLRGDNYCPAAVTKVKKNLIHSKQIMFAETGMPLMNDDGKIVGIYRGSYNKHPDISISYSMYPIVRWLDKCTSCCSSPYIACNLASQRTLLNLQVCTSEIDDLLARMEEGEDESD